VRTSALAFVAGFLRSRRDVAHESETVFGVDGESRPATVYRPQSGRRRSPAWVVLQGAAVPGRHHEGVRHLARGLASAGHFAFVPEVPAWTSLEVRPEETEPTLRSALAELGRWPEVDGARVGIAGFSVPATWALLAAAALGPSVRCVLTLGGYADFRRTMLATVCGEHEWRGEHFRHSPDPYGRWILGGDLLPSLGDDEHGSQQEREVAADALRRLAVTAGRNGALAATPVYDRLISDLRESLPPSTHRAFDLLAPPSTRPQPGIREQRRLAGALAEAGLHRSALMDTERRLSSLRAPVLLMHGRNDTLIPFTETLRLESMLPPPVERRLLITGVVGHAKTSSLLSHPQRLSKELWQLASAADWFLSKFR
jgi:pimeloyl-ACP methyl ester carboxylesterase